jgi:hypothetical protein
VDLAVRVVIRLLSNKEMLLKFLRVLVGLVIAILLVLLVWIWIAGPVTV